MQKRNVNMTETEDESGSITNGFMLILRPDQTEHILQAPG